MKKIEWSKLFHKIADSLKMGGGSETEASAKEKPAKKPMQFSLKKLIAKRSFKYGAASSSYALIFIAAVVVVNIIVSVLAQRLPLKVDLTPEKFYDIADSKSYIQSVKDKVNIIILTPEAQFKSDNGEQGSMTIELIHKYTVLNPNITFTPKDLYVNPQLKEKYKDATLTETSIIVESNKRYKVMDNADFYVTQSSDDGSSSVITAFKGEQKLTSAIQFVTSTAVPTMLFTNSHEESGYDGLQELAENNNFQVKTVDLQQNAIPDDTKIITIVNPKRDFTTDEINALDNFADKGQVGFLVFLDPGVQKATIPNLTDFLTEWKITPDDDFVLDDQYYFQNDPRILIPERAEGNDITSGIDTNVKAIVPFSKSLTIDTDLSNLYDVTSIMKSLNSSYSKANVNSSTTSSREKNDQTGPFDIAAISTKGITGTSYTSKMVVFGSSEIANTYFMDSNSYANNQILLNAMNSIRGSEDIVEILPKYFDDYSMTNTNVETNFFGIIFIVIIPLTLLILGLVVFLRRRHL